MPRSQPGELNPAARLREPEVQRMRALYATGLIRQGELVRIFGVSRGTVQAVVQHRHWRHLRRSES